MRVAKVTWGGLHNKRGKDQLRASVMGGLRTLSHWQRRVPSSRPIVPF